MSMGDVARQDEYYDLASGVPMTLPPPRQDPRETLPLWARQADLMPGTPEPQVGMWPNPPRVQIGPPEPPEPPPNPLVPFSAYRALPPKRTAGVVMGELAAPSLDPLSLGLMVGGGPLARGAGALMGAVLDPSEAEGGVLTKLKRGIRAYHGSPHVFDRFDISKVGTGEGAQAYGHGLYFAENPALAEFYRSQLAGGPEITRFTVGGRTVGPHNNFDYSPRGRSNYENVQSSLIEDALINQSELVGDPAKAQDYVVGLLKDRLKTMPEEWPQAVPDAQRLLADIQKPGGVHLKMGPRPGATYEVNINADPAHFLDWDKPLSTPHVEAIGNALENRIVQNHPDWRTYMQMQSDLPTSEGADLWKLLTSKDVAGMKQPAASSFLQEQGIPGIKYLDQGSRGAGQGSSNYVVFNDKLIDILRKYGLAGAAPAGMGALAAQDQYGNP